MAQQDLWDDPARAQGLLRKLSVLKETIETWKDLEHKTNSLLDLAEECQRAGDNFMENEIQDEADRLLSILKDLERDLMFCGEYDSRNAILSLHAGAGGTESQDWAQILQRMYMRWAEKNNYRADVLEISQGEAAGIKSATIEIKGKNAYGLLRSEHGVHRLVRLSPFDADHARHTSFVLIEVLPEAEKDVDIKVSPDEIKIDTFRASGPGGQHMQKTSTAVRVTHLPTGIVVSYQSERSQFQNKDIALRILQSRLLQLEVTRKAEEMARLKGERIEAGWGSQIRSYVLQPYKLVKDHRTGYESGNPVAVLDGEIDGFLDAYLHSLIGQEV